MSSPSIRCRSARRCPACASASPPATAVSSRAFLELRNVAAPQVPVPLQHVAVAAYNDERHVEENRRLYGEKFDLADRIIGDRYGYKRPAGGFFLWLDVSAHGGSEAVDRATVAARPACASCPAAISRAIRPTDRNPGADYIRVAMVQDKATTAEALRARRRRIGLELMVDSRSAGTLAIATSTPSPSSRITSARSCGDA